MKKLPFLFLAALLYACGGGNSTEDEATCASETTDSLNEVSEEKVDAVEIEDGLFLSGLYATSYAEGNEVENLFDGDEGTSWMTAPGTSIDEGIMLNFIKSKYINTISLKGAKSVERVQIYVNGQSVTATNDLEKISIDNDVETMFIKILRGGEMSIKTLEETECEMTSSQVVSENTSAGFSEIVFEGSEDVLDIKAPKKIKASIEASSTLEPATAYNVANLFDSRSEFAWVDGVEGDGVGESFTVNFEKEVWVDAIIIKNGYQRSQKHFNENTRAKKITLKTETGTESLSIKDEMGAVTIDLSQMHKSKSYTFTIDEVYAGTKYKDLAISDLVFLSKKMVVAPDNNFDGTLREEFKSQVAGTPLESLLNKRLQYSFTVMDCGEDNNQNRSLILRSNGTFVMYEENYDDNGGESTTEKIVADGNWKVKDKQEDKIVINVFGKHVNLSKISQVYSGTSMNELLRIFNDNVTITGSSLKGERFVGEYKY